MASSSSSSSSSSNPDEENLPTVEKSVETEAPEDPVLQPLGSDGEQETSTGKQVAHPRKRGAPDRHVKVEGRGRRIRMSSEATARLFELTRQLGHKSEGETVRWLLENAKDEIMKVAGSGTVPAIATSMDGTLVIPRGSAAGNVAASSANTENAQNVSESCGLGIISSTVQWPQPPPLP